MPFYFMPPDPEILGEHIKRARQRLGMNQTQFAQALGAQAGQAQVSKWETGKVVATPESIEAIAALIDMTPDTFMDGVYSDMGRAGVRHMLPGAQQGVVRERPAEGEPSRGVSSAPIDLLKTVEIPEGLRRQAGRATIHGIFAHVYAIGVDEGFSDQELKVLEAWRDAELAKLGEEDGG